MESFEKKLVVRKSTLPGAGKGLFTKVFIPKGSRIIEYKGIITTWAGADYAEGNNAYLFYVTRNHVIDASKQLHELARFVNDAEGLLQVKGIKNNAEYSVKKKQVFVMAATDIEAGQEIFVAYGQGYWDTIRANKNL